MTCGSRRVPVMHSTGQFLAKAVQPMHFALLIS